MHSIAGFVVESGSGIIGAALELEELMNPETASAIVNLSCSSTCSRSFCLVNGSVAIIRAHQTVSVEAVHCSLLIVVSVARNSNFFGSCCRRGNAVSTIEVTSPHAVEVPVLNVAITTVTLAHVVEPEVGDGCKSVAHVLVVETNRVEGVSVVQFVPCYDWRN